jgi:hypothetical protein
LIFAVCKLPTFLALKRGDLVKWPLALVVGVLPGLIALLLLNWHSMGENPLLAACIGGVAGGEVATTFWLIWRHRADEDPQATTS